MNTAVGNEKLRAMLIARFNERINDPASFLEVPSKSKLIIPIETGYDLVIPQLTIGHGALVLIEVERRVYEAIPFAINPVHVINATEDDFVYGFHEHVANEVAHELKGTGGYHLDATLDMWRQDSGQIVAVGRGSGREFSRREIESVRRLTLETPDVMFASRRFDDEAYIKIAHGIVYARQIGQASTWRREDPMSK